MHELAITQNLIAMIEIECKKHQIQNPTKIIVDLGLFTTYSKDSILFYFNILRKELPFLQKTKLQIKVLQGKIQCADCHSESIVKDPHIILCQKCHSFNVQILQGREIILKEICRGD